MPSTLIDHTADIGIHVTGRDLKELFADAAYAMFEQITDISRLKGEHKKRITVEGIDRHDLLINWLRELLCFWTIDAGLVKKVKIGVLDETRITGDISYDSFDPKRHEILKDIKAVTYYGISVDRTREGWEATVVFDV